MIYIREDVRPLFKSERSVSDFLNIQGEVIKHVVISRRTIRFTRDGKMFYLKAHWGVGWKEIFKNLVTFHVPVLGARNEWRAIRVLERLGIDTMDITAYGEEGSNPAAIRSFLITDALANTVDLERWLPILLKGRATPETVRLKRAVIHRVAEIARVLHTHGINHRDFYLCHLRIDLSGNASYPNPRNLRIYVMDLHRAQVRHRTPMRWIIKDIAALLYSSLYACQDLRLSRTDYLRFMEAYSAMSWRQSLTVQRRFWRQVVRRTVRTYIKSNKAKPALPDFLSMVLD